MNTEKDNNFERENQELKSKVDFGSTSKTEPILPEIQTTKFSQTETWLNSAKNWFNNLPTAGRVAVGILLLAVGFSILNTVLHLIFSLLTITAFGVVLYFVYKYFISPESSEN